MYFAVIGDMVNSKKAKDRSHVQQKLLSILADINIRFKEDVASGFIITLGDEFQGLLKSGKNVLHAIEEIEMRMHPVRIRFGIGGGEISTPINPLMSLGADGSAYHNARLMIDEMKKDERKKKRVGTIIRISTDCSDKTIENSVNAIFSLSSFIKEGWTIRQREIIEAMKASGDSQVKAAEKLSVGQSSIQKSLSNSGYYIYMNAINTASDIITKKWG